MKELVDLAGAAAAIGLVLTMIFACDVPADQGRWKVWICPKEASACTGGTDDFFSKEECEDFAKKANLIQQNATRFCSRMKSY